MKARTIGTSIVSFLVGAALALAADANMGTWKLNEGKSKISAGTGKNLNVVYAAAGDKIKVVVDGVDGAGKPTHNEWVGMFDGKDYAVTGDPNSDTRSYKKVDASTMELTTKKGGKAMVSGKIVLAADGKSRTLTVNGTDAAGKTVATVAVYDKQ